MYSILHTPHRIKESVNESKRQIIREIIKKKTDDKKNGGVVVTGKKTATGQPVPDVTIDPVVDIANKGKR